jgi:predicted N-acetyltransferase YhbS
MQLSDIQVEAESDPDGAIAATIEDRLIEALRQNVPPNDSEPLILLARKETTIVGGLVGATSYGWLLVKMLWVAAAVRRRGLGSGLMVKAEILARARRCHGAWLDTSSVDVERFYERLGYTAFGVLQNLGDERPPGHRRVFLGKRFA